MKKLILLLAALGVVAASKADTFVGLLPAPAEKEVHSERFTFSRKSTFIVENDEQRDMVSMFVGRLSKAAGFSPAIRSRGKGSIIFTTDASIAPESYILDITAGKITVKASEGSGFFYALQTLRQLLPADIESSAKADAEWSVPAMHIEDSPRFGYRGLLLDVSRFFIPKEEVLRIVECMSMLKINKLHLHLSDDNGWRIEIKRYPRLTEVGAWRVEREGVPFPARRNPSADEPVPVGGFYTQDDIREIVAYAAERYIEVIPEIDMPAHSNAALAAYPELACPVVDKFIGVLPGIGGDNADIIYCAGNDKVFEFLQNVLDEIMDLFPSHYIHVGGDEAWKTHWKRCPLCQARIKAEGLADEEELQGWFMERMCSYVRSKGREVIGWDELTNSRLPEDVIIDGWQGFGQAALKAAKQGHRFIMTPARIMYFIRYQGPQWFEPATYFGNNTLEDVYMYEPVRPNWPAEYEPLLMGVQACMWTEFCNSSEDVEYLLFPRLAALAEVGWCRRDTKDWPQFLARLDAFLPRLEAHGITYARSMYNIQQTVKPQDGALQVSLECIRPDVEIRCTVDGTNPTAESPLYESPLTLRSGTVLKCATFADGKRAGEVLELPLVWNKATAKKILNAKGDENLLVNGVHGSLKHTDSEWCTWDDCDDISLTLDLGCRDTFESITLGFITNYGMFVHKPSHILIEASDDNETYAVIAERAFTADDIFREGTYRSDAEFRTGAQSARYIRITMKGAGECPADHVRPHKMSKVYMDEITIL